MICKLKARLNLHGILNVESGYYVEDVEVEEPVEEDEKKDGDVSQPPFDEECCTNCIQAMDADTAGEKKTRKVKKQVRKGDLPISAGTSGLEEATKSAWTEKENAMTMEDKLVADTDEKKNELESYIYELRDKVETTYAEFSSEEEKEKLRAKLTEAEVSSADFSSMSMDNN
jgi:heat shock protein 4